MEWNREWKPLAFIIAVFISCYYLPIGYERFDNAVTEALHLIKWYAREHVLLCLIPAFFIAGGNCFRSVVKQFAETDDRTAAAMQSDGGASADRLRGRTFDAFISCGQPVRAGFPVSRN